MDIIERLRVNMHAYGIAQEAADEIERLRAELAISWDTIEALKAQGLLYEEDRDRLRELWFSDADPAETEYAEKYAAQRRS